MSSFGEDNRVEIVPILSICIPTYNRAELLESALTSLASQLRKCGDEVELIVLDNCSTDSTAEVVERMEEQCPIRYHKNDENVGVVRNVLSAVRNFARGEFCWVMGDDEMVRDGGVQKLLEAIREHSNLDYFYINYSIDSFERREGVFVTREDFRKWTRTGNQNLEERLVDRWETLIAEDFSGLTPIYCSVFRRSVWLRASESLDLSVPYSSVDETFPHSLIFARTMMGKPAWSSGFPWIIMCGKESWSAFIPAVVLLRFHELLDCYIELGADARLVDSHRRRMLDHAGHQLTKMLEGEELPMLESFSLVGFMFKHYHYRELWRAVNTAALLVSVGEIASQSIFFTLFAVPAKVVYRLHRLWKKARDRLGFSLAARGN